MALASDSSMGVDTCVGVKIPNLQKLISTYRTHLGACGLAVCSLRKPGWPPVVPFGRQRPSSPAPGRPCSRGVTGPAQSSHGPPPQGPSGQPSSHTCACAGRACGSLSLSEAPHLSRGHRSCLPDPTPKCEQQAKTSPVVYAWLHHRLPTQPGNDRLVSAPRTPPSQPGW